VFLTVAVNAVITFPWLIAFLYCVGDLDAVLASPIGFTTPMTQVFINSTKSIGAGIFLNAMATSIAFGAGVDTTGATARTIYAMARDKAFPSFLAKVDTNFDVPIWAMLLAAVPQYIIGLIYIWNSTAFYGIMSGVLVIQMSSYLVPIALHLFWGRRSGTITYGPWNMGRFGWIVDSLSFAWCLFLIVFLSFPLYQPVTAANM
jgi:choline transport protein